MTPLLADENIPLPSIRRLRAEGYDVLAIAKVSPGAEDLEVLGTARDTGRVLVTFDRDFGELIYRDLAPVPPGVLFLRDAYYDPGEAAELLIRVLTDAEIEVVGYFSVVTKDGVRQRRLE